MKFIRLIGFYVVGFILVALAIFLICTAQLHAALQELPPDEFTPGIGVVVVLYAGISGFGGLIGGVPVA